MNRQLSNSPVLRQISVRAVMERLLRDAILLSIGGGTNEAMQKNMVADLKRVYGGR